MSAVCSVQEAEENGSADVLGACYRAGIAAVLMQDVNSA